MMTRINMIENNSTNLRDSNYTNNSMSKKNSSDEESEISIKKLKKNEKLKISYINDLIKGYKFLMVREYEKSLPLFNNCIKISEKLEDNYNLSDSLCNYSICLFYQGNLEESLKFIQLSLINVNKITLINDKVISLKIKILSNLTLTNISIGLCNEALNSFNQLIEMIDEIASEKKRKYYIKLIIFNFFKVNGLVNYEIENNSLNVSNNSNYQENSSKINLNISVFNIFHKYMRNNDNDYWINSLSQEINKIKSNNSFIDTQSLIFLTFQYEIARSNNKKNFNECCNKINGICNYLKNQMNIPNEDHLKKPEIIIKLQNEKLNLSKQIYKILYSKEEELLNSKNINEKNEDILISKTSYVSSSIFIDFENKNCSKEFLKLLLKYSLKIVENDEKYNNQQGKKMLNQLNLTNELLNKNMLNLSGIKISDFDRNITQSLINLFENLIFIYYRHMILNGLYKYKKKVNVNYLVIRDKKVNNYLLNNFLILQQGEILTKINYSSLGIKEHFYKIYNNEDNDNYELRIYNTISDKKPKKIILLNSIKKVTYGIYSDNIKKKFLNINQKKINSPWLFLSIFYKEKTIDLYLIESKLIKWFYGFYSFFKMYQCPFKIISVRYFVLNRIKLLAIHNLREINDENENENISGKDNLLINHLSNEQGIQQFSFCKIILLYNKISSL